MCVCIDLLSCCCGRDVLFEAEGDGHVPQFFLQSLRKHGKGYLVSVLKLIVMSSSPSAEDFTYSIKQYKASHTNYIQRVIDKNTHSYLHEQQLAAQVSSTEISSPSKLCLQLPQPPQVSVRPTRGKTLHYKKGCRILGKNGIVISFFYFGDMKFQQIHAVCSCTDMQ